MKSVEMLKNFWLNEDGGEIVEYAIVIGILVVAIAGIMTTISDGASEKLTAISDELTAE